MRSWCFCFNWFIFAKGRSIALLQPLRFTFYFSLLFGVLACLNLHIPFKLEAYSPFSVSSKQGIMFFINLPSFNSLLNYNAKIQHFFPFVKTFCHKNANKMNYFCKYLSINVVFYKKSCIFAEQLCKYRANKTQNPFILITKTTN